MKRRYSMVALAITMLLTTVLPDTAWASNGVNQGRFTDYNTMTWTTWDGVSTTYGRGPKFSDVRPDVTDPEYFLKGYYEQEGGSWDYPYTRDSAAYNDALATELKAFVHSFDWINSDELTRANMVHDRIANNCHGNTYEHATEAFSVLMTGKGTCRNFSGEFQYLARFVGLECEVYTPFFNHQACLIKINGQWFATDPTAGQREGLFLSNATTYPVDYETEYNRYANETEQKWEKEAVENPNGLTTLKLLELNRQLAEGSITLEQFNKLVDEAEKNDMDRLLTAGTITLEQYNNYIQSKK